VVEGLVAGLVGEKVVVAAAGRAGDSSAAEGREGDSADRLCWQVMSHNDIMLECY
jgi:hypothetical protein